MHTFRKLSLAVLLSAPLFASAASNTAPPNAPAAPKVEPPRIQLAILLDTSSSMDGLIDQARQQLWQAVGALGQARRDGVAPRLEVAVYEYGNDGLAEAQGYTRQVLGLSTELDRVSEALFALSTNGGSEFCGYAIDRAVRDLQWSAEKNDLHIVFIAGNEAFAQGPVAWQQAIASARARGIVVNTIHAGDEQTGIAEGWQQGAQLAGGVYRSIDANQAIAHIDAPQDAEIARLNEELNTTYIPFGAEGAASSARQKEQDQANASVAPALLAERAQAKASKLYENTQWDLVDAFTAGKVAPESVPASQLPAEMQALDTAARKDYVRTKAEQRTRLQSRIRELGDERADYVAQQAAAAPAATLGDSMLKAVREQGAGAGFRFEATER